MVANDFKAIIIGGVLKQKTMQSSKIPHRCLSKCKKEEEKDNKMIFVKGGGKIFFS